MGIRENTHRVSDEVWGTPAYPRRAGDGFQPRLTPGVSGQRSGQDFGCPNAI